MSSSESLKSLSNTLIGIKSLCIYRLGSVLCEVGVRLNLNFSLHALNIVARKSILIDKTGLRRNLIELNLIPLTSRHKLFNDVDTSSQNRKSLTILLMRHLEVSTSYITKSAGFLGTGILRLKPLRKKRRSLTLNIESELLADESKSFCLKRSSYEAIEIIPSTIFGDILHITAHCFCCISSQPARANSEEASFSLSASTVGYIEKTLERILRVLLISLLK